MMKKLFTFFILSLFLVSFITAGAGTGMDETFEYLGLDKPTEWDSWTRDVKFSWMQERGIYQEAGEKYKGSANTDKFFSEYLKTEKPDDWDSKTFEEKQEFIESVKNPVQDSFEEVSLKQISNKPIDFIGITFAILSVFIVLASFLKPGSKIKKFARIVCYYVFPAAFILVTIFYTSKHLLVNVGFWAERMLIFLLFVKPFSIIFSSKILSRAVNFRKELGLTTFWLFILHATGLWFLYDMAVADILVIPRLFWGIVASIALIIGAITSNKKSMVILKKNWKKVQMVAYIALFGTLFHTSIVAGNMMKLYVIFGLFAILKILEWKGVKLRKGN